MTDTQMVTQSWAEFNSKIWLANSYSHPLAGAGGEARGHVLMLSTLWPKVGQHMTSW